MTTQELLALAGQNPQMVAAMLVAAPASALALQLGPKQPREASAWAYAWSTVVYLACVPGILAATVLLYSLAFTKTDLLKLDLGLCFGPLAAMLGTLILAKRKVRIGSLPGVDRLGGFLMMLVATFVALIFIDRTRIVMLFHGSFGTLVVLALVLFVVFKLGFARLTAPPKHPQGH